MIKNQKIIILVGVDFSGREEKAQKLNSEMKDSIVITNQDKARDYLNVGKTIIVDTPNLTLTDRAFYINLGKELNITVETFAFVCSYEWVLKNSKGRANEDEIKNQMSKLTWPKNSEIDNLIVVNSETGEEYTVTAELVG